MPRPVKSRGRPTSTPEAQARLPELLAIPPDADAASRFGEIAAETPGGALALIEALGGSREEAAGQILAAIAASAPDREQRKSARRALHRLRSTGVAVSVPIPAEPSQPASAPVEMPPPTRALVTPIGGIGSRILFLLIERPLGGMTTFSLAINDVVGLKGTLIEETTRRRFERRVREWHETNQRTTVELPVEYGLRLLSEALALNAESDFPLPREFVLRRSLLGGLPPPPTDALIHQHISRGQTFLMPNLLEESARLLDGEPELLGWVFNYDEVKPFAQELRTVEESRLLLTSEPREARQERVIGTAIDTLLTPVMRRAFRRRLEETAYVFWQTGRERPARQAVAAAFAIPDTGTLRTHPLLRAIVLRSIELAIEVDRSGMPPPPGANRSPRDPI